MTAGEGRPPLWPAGHRAPLCVTFNVDGPNGEANDRARDETYWLSQTAYDPVSTVRILELLAGTGVPATFCWVGRAAVEGHEIVLHTWDHRSYNRLSDDEQRTDMRRTFETLAGISQTMPAGHKSGGWRYNDFTHALAQEIGLAWVMDEPGDDLPYPIQPDAERPPLVQLPPSRLYDDSTYFVDQILTPRQTFEFWRDDLDVLRAEGKLICLTLHPFVSSRPGPSRSIARLIDYAIDAGDVWIARGPDRPGVAGAARPQRPRRNRRRRRDLIPLRWNAASALTPDPSPGARERGACVRRGAARSNRPVPSRPHRRACPRSPLLELVGALWAWLGVRVGGRNEKPSPGIRTSVCRGVSLGETGFAEIPGQDRHDG